MRNRIAVLMMAAAIATGAAQARMTESLAAEPVPARQQALLHLLKQDCGSCHGLTLKGGLGPALLPEVLHDKADDMLVDTILYGRPGTPMPPWAFSLTAEEARWLVLKLRTGDVDG